MKGVIQKVLSLMPGGVRVNHALQRTVGLLRRFEADVDNKVGGNWVALASSICQLSPRFEGLELLEVGTGWHPALPFCFSLAGARSCRTDDLNRYLSPRLTFRMLRRLEMYLDTIARVSGRSLTDVQEAYRELRGATTLADLLSRARVTYCAPSDAARTGLPAASVDIVFSNNVLEHLKPETVVAIMRETRRVLRPEGFALHRANCGDHYSYFDRSITQINYLAYPERKWRFWNNRLLYQNRLRPQDFVELAQSAGLDPVIYEYKPNPVLLEALSRMKVAPEFRRYSPDQLCSTSVHFAARPKPRSGFQ